MSPAAKGFYARLGVALLIGLVGSPLVALLLPDTPFHRVMTRTFLVTLIVAFAVGSPRPRAWPRAFRAMGLRGPHRLARFAAGFLVALVLLTGLLWVSWLLDGRAARIAPYDRSLAAHLAGAAVSALLVSYLEEILCRGYMKDALGGPMSAFLYAIAHFFRPAAGSAPAGEGFDPLLGFKRFPELLESWGNPRLATLGVLSLFLFGLALNRLRERTGTLLAGIGLHAGLVFAVDLYRRVLHDQSLSSPWVFGGPRLHDGLLGTILIAGLYLLVVAAPLPGWARAGEPGARRP